MAKYEPIDLLKLYAGTSPIFSRDVILGGRRDSGEGTAAKADISQSAKAFNAHAAWNQWLTKCFNQNNINELIKVRYGLQLGMDDLVKKKLNTPEIAQMFVRWTGSIEKTARKIIKKQNPVPKDLEQRDFLRWKAYKKKIDVEFEKFLRKASY